MMGERERERGVGRFEGEGGMGGERRLISRHVCVCVRVCVRARAHPRARNAL